MRIIVDTMYTTVDYEGNTLLREKVHDMVHRTVDQGGMGVMQDGAMFNRAYKAGVWDGITDFYNFKEDKFHTGLLQIFLDSLKELQKQYPTLTYEIDDIRPNPLVSPNAIDEEIVLGNGEEDPITLRDYQYESVKRVFEEQIGIVNAATNSGKCLTKFSNLLTSEGIMTVEEFFNKAGYQAETREEVVPYTRDIKLVNRYGKLEKPSHLTFNGLKEVVEITGHRGTKNTVTLNHPLLTVSQDGTFQWKEAKDIQVGDYLVGRIKDNIFGSSTLVYDEKEAYCLGAIVADGYINQDKFIEMVSGDKEVIDIVEKYLLSLTDKDKLYHDKTLKNSYRIRLYSKKVTNDWHEKFGIKYGVAKDKHVPQCILESPRNIQLAFLSGYLESEGSFDPKGSLEVISASKTLIYQVGLMLRNIGYVPTIRKKKVKGYEHNDYYRLSLGSTDTINLLQELTFITQSRKEQLTEFYESVNSRNRNNKKESVPFGKQLVDLYRNSYKKEDRTKDFSKRFKVPKTISKTRLRGIVQDFDKGDPTLHKILSDLADEHYVFEEVVEIRSIGEQPTFDVCMPETHSFIADGIINHNTEVAAGIIQQVLPYLKRGQRVAFFTHSKEIFHQSASRIAKRLNMRESQIGKIGDGKFDIKNKQVVFVMIPTLASALKDPKKDVKFTHNEKVIKFIATEVAPKFLKTANTRHLLRNYLKNCTLTTKIWQSAEEHLQYIAYDNRFTDKSAQMQLNKYIVEFDKIMEKKANKKYKKYKEVQEFIESVTVMICDEGHHVKANTWYDTLSLCTNASYRVALTGTVDKKDKMSWMKLRALFSDIIVKVSNDFLISRGVSSKPTIRVVPITEPRNIELAGTYLEAYKLGIVENELRNNLIAQLVEAYRKRRPGGVLISVKEIDHGDRILEKLRERGLEAEFIHGGSDTAHRASQLQRFASGDLKVLIASTIIDEGVDVKSIGCMILAAGGKSMRQQLQRIGRGLRLNGIDGNSVMVFDFYDQTHHLLLKHSKERIKIFQEEKFDVKVMK